MLWGATTISSVGTQTMWIALGIYAYQLTNSASLLGLVYLAEVLAAVVCGIFGGILIDRADRIRLMYRGELVSLAITPCLLLVNSVETAQVLPFFAFVYVVLGRLFDAGRAAVTPSLVPADELVAAAGLNGSTTSLVTITAPLAGAAILASAGMGPLVALDAITFLVSAVLLRRLYRARGPASARVPTTQSTFAGVWRVYRTDLRDGVAYVRGVPLLRTLILFGAVNGLVNGIGNVIYLPWITHDFGASSAAYAVSVTLMGAGALLGGAALATWGARISSDALLYCSGTVGLFFLAMSAAPTYPVLLAVFFCAGVLNALVGAGISAKVGQVVDDSYRGRYSALWMLCFSVTAALSAIATPHLVPLVGYRATWLPA